MASVGSALGAAAAPGSTASTPGSTATPASEKARLAHAATEFEAVLLGQWLDGAERSFATVPGSEEDEDAGGQQIRGFAMQQLAHTLAAKDTLGIAHLVQGGLEKAAAAGAHTVPPSADAQGALRAKLPTRL